uniref:Band 3 anion transport protein n=1 Tax=Schistosoma haematobium TaxID=6185 RepID=A0A094ZP24_SCHHA
MQRDNILYVVEEEHSGGSDNREGYKLSFHTGSYPTQMFIELQELVPRVDGGLQFNESIFKMPVAAHFRVLWLETARWVNFEENFNEVEQRFTEAHVPPMKFSCINSFRDKLQQNLKIIQTDALTLGQALDEVAKYALSQNCIQGNEQYDVLRAILFAERWHPEVKGHISDAAEFDQYWAGTLPEGINPAYENDEGKWTFKNFQSKLESARSSISSLTFEVKKPAFLQRASVAAIGAKKHISMTRASVSTNDFKPKEQCSVKRSCVSYNDLGYKLSLGSREQGASSLSKALSIHNECQHPYHRYNQPLTNCLSSGSEACTVICGLIEFVKSPILVLLRLNKTIQRSCISEVDIPVRFIFIYVGPQNDELNYAELARIFAVMMTNDTFRLCVYDSISVDDIIKGIDNFMQDSFVMPLSRHYNANALAGMTRQIEAYRKETVCERDGDRRPKGSFTVRKLTEQSQNNLVNGSYVPSSLNLKQQADNIIKQDSDKLPVPTNETDTPKISKRKIFLRDFCPPFIELSRGIRPWIKRMPGDYKDAVRKENFSIVFGSVLFIYFVNLSPSITFAALLNTQVDPSYTVTLTLLAVGVFLIIFTILSGQPLAIIGISAPMYIVESSLVSVSRSTGVDFKQLRFWSAFYCSIFGFIFVGCNMSGIAKHIRRSVEEVYNSFIGFFFLLKALFTMFLLIPAKPVDNTPISRMAYYQKLAVAGVTLFLAFIMLQFCLILAQLKRGNYFRRNIRKLLGALNVPLGMLLITGLERIFFRGYNLPTVNIPPSNQVNASTWVNPPDFARLQDYSKAAPTLIHGTSIAIGVALAIIIFTEAALNGLTAMKNKAVKPNIFVMDLVLLQIIFPTISGITGWPFMSGTTVRTLSNLVALVKMDQSPAPGMPHKIVGTVEQRVSGVFVGILVALSIFLGSILSNIPLAALYGMFLYMGVMGLRDLTFVLRICSLMKRRKHWEDWECVRGLPSRHILVFSLIQAAVVLILVSLNIISDFTVANYVGLIFPIIILIYGLIREFALPKWEWLALYLHQLDRKYKLHPSVMRKPPSTVRNLSTIRKESVGSFASGGLTVTSQLKTNNFIEYIHDHETASYSDISEHEDGVVRRTWAT